MQLSHFDSSTFTFKDLSILTFLKYTTLFVVLLINYLFSNKMYHEYGTGFQRIKWLKNKKEPKNKVIKELKMKPCGFFVFYKFIFLKS